MKRHHFDFISFVLGILVTGMGIVFLSSGELPNVDGVWVLAGALVLLGAVVVLSGLRRKDIKES